MHRGPNPKWSSATQEAPPRRPQQGSPSREASARKPHPGGPTQEASARRPQPGSLRQKITEQNRTGQDGRGHDKIRRDRIGYNVTEKLYKRDPNQDLFLKADARGSVPLVSI